MKPTTATAPTDYKPLDAAHLVRLLDTDKPAACRAWSALAPADRTSMAHAVAAELHAAYNSPSTAHDVADFMHRLTERYAWIEPAALVGLFRTDRPAARARWSALSGRLQTIMVHRLVHYFMTSESVVVSHDALAAWLDAESAQ